MRRANSSLTIPYDDSSDIHIYDKSAPLYWHDKMKIANGNALGQIRSSKAGKTKQTNGTGFDAHMTAPTEGGSLSGAGGVSGVGALLAAQAVGDALDGRAQAYDRAEGLLKRLDGLRLALLDGNISDQALRRLADDMNADKINNTDELLGELLAEIELRAAVELAKRGLI